MVGVKDRITHAGPNPVQDWTIFCWNCYKLSFIPWRNFFPLCNSVLSSERSSNVTRTNSICINTQRCEPNYIWSIDRQPFRPFWQTSFYRRGVGTLWYRPLHDGFHGREHTHLVRGGLHHSIQLGLRYICISKQCRNI